MYQDKFVEYQKVCEDLNQARRDLVKLEKEIDSKRKKRRDDLYDV